MREVLVCLLECVLPLCSGELLMSCQDERRITAESRYFEEGYRGIDYRDIGCRCRVTVVFRGKPTTKSIEW